MSIKSLLTAAFFLFSLALVGQQNAMFWAKKDDGGAVNTDFVTTWNTTNTSGGSSGANAISLPLVAGGTYNFTVDWGDGNTGTVTSDTDPDKTHTYATGGTKTVTISGALSGWTFLEGGDLLKIISVDNWGTALLGDFENYFRGCSNLVSVASDGDPFSATIDGSSAFRDCSSLIEFPALPMGNVETLQGSFRGCTSMTSFLATQTGKVDTWISTFNGCDALTTLPAMDFTLGEKFQFFALNADGITTLGAGFASTMGLLDNGSDMFSGVTLNTASWSNFLIDIEGVNSTSGVTLNGGNSKYNPAGGTARAALIADHGWTITDGGAE